MNRPTRLQAIWEFMDVWKERPADTKPIFATKDRGRWMRRMLTRLEKYKNERQR